MSKLHPIAKKHGYKSNEDFYKDFPDEQSYKMAMGGESGAPHNGQPDYKEFFNYGYIPSGPKFFYQDGGQPDAQEFYDYGYIPSGPEFFYQKGGNIPKAYSDAGMKLSNDEVLSFARNMMAMGELSRDVKSPSEMYKVYDTLTPNDRERVMLLIKSPEGMNLFQDDRYMRQHNFSPFNPYNVPQQIRQHNERNRVYQDGGSNTNKYSTTDDKSFLDQFRPKLKLGGATKYDGQSQDEYLNGMKKSFVNSLSNNAQMAFHKEAMEAALNPQQESNPYEDESQEYAQDGGRAGRNSWGYLMDAFNRQPGWSYPGQSQGRPGMINTQGGYDTKYTGSDLKNIDFSNVDPRGVKIDINKRGVLNRLAPKQFGPKSFSVSFGDYNGPQDNSNPAPISNSNTSIPITTSPFFNATPPLNVPNQNYDELIYNNQPNPYTINPDVMSKGMTSRFQNINEAMNPFGRFNTNFQEYPSNFSNYINAPQDQGSEFNLNTSGPREFRKGGPLLYAQSGVSGISFPGAGLGYGFDDKLQQERRDLALSGASANQPQNQTILNSDQTVQSNMAMSGNMDNKGWTPNASTAAGRFDFKRKNNMTGETKANLALAGTAGLGNLLGMDEQMAAEEAAAVKTGADQQFYANNQYDIGTYTPGEQGPNINFRPNQQTPVQFTGQAPTEYNTWSGKYGGQPCYECGGSYKQDGGEQYGGEVYMSEDEIQQFLADGGQLEFLD